MKEKQGIAVYWFAQDGIPALIHTLITPVATDHEGSVDKQAHEILFHAFYDMGEDARRKYINHGIDVRVVPDVEGAEHFVTIIGRLRADGQQLSIPGRIAWRGHAVALLADDRMPVPWQIAEDGRAWIDWQSIGRLIGGVRAGHHSPAGIPEQDHAAVDYALLEDPVPDAEAVPSYEFTIHAAEEDVLEPESALDAGSEPRREPVADVGSPASAVVPRAMPRIKGDRPAMAVMEKVPEAPIENSEWSGAALLYSQYKVLSEPLPLLGGDAMEMEGERVRMVRELAELFPWMGGAIDAIEKACRMQTAAGRPWFQAAPLLLVGPPGSGKSSFVRAMARLAGVAHTSLDCAATHDAVTIAGTPRGFSTATPCLPAVVMERARSANPIIQLDEVEKASRSSHGYLPDAVLGMTEPSTSAAYYDQCLLRRLDLSACTWVATANHDDTLSSAFKSRFTVIRVEAAGREHLDAVIRGIADEVASDWSVPMELLAPVTGEARRILGDRLAAGSLRTAGNMLRQLWSRDIMDNGRPDLN